MSLYHKNAENENSKNTHNVRILATAGQRCFALIHVTYLGI